jgi:beta-N-acetylhexosaminidase
VLRGRLGFDGVVITDALLMRAVRERWGHARAAVLALAAGADMALAQGAPHERQAAVDAVAEALASGALAPDAALASKARLDALAVRFPVAPAPYPAAQRAADAALMRDAWARGLTVFGGAVPPARDTPLRVVTQREVPSDGVHEAGPPAAALRPLFTAFADVEWVEVDDLRALDPDAFAPERVNLLLGNQPQRYPEASADWPVDLHVALWKPFQVAQVAAPAVVTWGYADGALAALRAWLEAEAGAPGRSPVALAPHPKGAR